MKPIIDEPMPRRARWGAPELARLTAMVRQPSLFYWKGPQTEALRAEFTKHYPLEAVFPTSSGSAACHVAVASLRLQPGDEVIVPAITDMGSVIGILYQQAVPVFADVDPGTYNLAVDDVRRRLTAQTRAIMPVHLAGNPCDLGPLMQLCQEHRLVMIEDCAQAWGAQWQGRPVGLIGHLACYSFNEYKHLSCGDGGVVATSDPRFLADLNKWGDKFYDRTGSERNPTELAPNYRMSEPQAAVAAAQLGRLSELIVERVRIGERLHQGLADLPGLRRPDVRPGDVHSYWFYLFRLEPEQFKLDRDGLAAALAAEGVPAEPGYIPHVVYRYAVFQNHNFFGGRWPVRDLGLTQMDYREVRCPVAEAVLSDCIRLTINEAMSDDYVDRMLAAIRQVLSRYRR